MSSEAVDTKYYQVAQPQTVAERLVVAARDRIYADFLHYCRPEPIDTILDVGVSDVVTDAANVLERSYPYPSRITAVGLGEGGAFRTEYPDVGYLQTVAGQPLPFADKAFDIATSNAVVEHLGSPDEQARFVRELMRVAKRVLITVPHRFFPVEHHTAIPLLHYTDATFAIACWALGKTEWAKRENLILMSKGRLRALVPSGCRYRIEYTGFRLGCFSSNLLLFIGPEK